VSVRGWGNPGLVERGKASRNILEPEGVLFFELKESFFSMES
jgi:hypothetical protein